MASKLIALPVGQGDSFYLQRDKESILFDGGRSENALPKMLHSMLSNKKIDVVVCSHNDADHANGIIGLLDDGGIEITEIWLPGRWQEGLARMAENPISFVENLHRESYRQDLRHDNLENYAEKNLENSNNLEDREESTENISDVIELLSESDWGFSNQLRNFDWPFFFMNSLFSEAIEAANRIVLIATKAYNRGCRIRWFDYKEFEITKHAKGGELWMRPLNSVEILRMKRTKFSGLQLLALSVANKESLVFLSETKDEPSVLFCADSNLKNVQLSSIQNLIATAPHHGADSNKAVYNLVKNSIWIRSDMNSSKRPCKEYTFLKEKYCTICNGNRKPKSEVIFTSSGAAWITNYPQCICQ